MPNTEDVSINLWKAVTIMMVGWVVPSFIVLAGVFVYPKQVTVIHFLMIPALAVGSVVFGAGVRLLKERRGIDG